MTGTNGAEEDKSSLYFSGLCTYDGDEMFVIVCNGADSGAMLADSTYEVYFVPTGNPKDGVIVEGGTIHKLLPGMCQELPIEFSLAGNYMVKAYQAEGHPGTEVLWSEECVRTEDVETEEEENEEENGQSTENGTTETGTATPISEHTPVEAGMPGFGLMVVTLGVVLFTVGATLVKKGLGK